MNKGIVSDRWSMILRSYLAALIILSALEILERFVRNPSEAKSLLAAISFAVSMIAAFSIWFRWGGKLVLALVIVIPVVEFVYVDVALANHMYWFIWNLLLFIFFWKPGSNDLEIINTICWMVIGVLMWSGMQKILYGAWIDANTFCAIIGVGDQRFAAFFNALGATESLAYCRSLSPAPGAGPYVVQNALVVWSSRTIVAAELILPVLLIFTQTRKYAAVTILAMIASIQIFAMELFFGLHMLNAVLLCMPQILVKLRWRYLIIMAVLGSWTMFQEIKLFP